MLLTCPRAAGHVFNPLSVFYCFAGSGELIAVIAEVHNTYGGRHVYLLRPDDAGRDTVGKEFYVSPFLPMGGDYLMRTPVPGERLAVSIALRQGGQTPFVATLSGRGRPIGTRSAVTALLRWPLLTLRTAALIRWQGVRLWLRKVPVQPRPADATRASAAADVASHVGAASALTARPQIPPARARTARRRALGTSPPCRAHRSRRTAARTRESRAVLSAAPRQLLSAPSRPVRRAP